ncbi:MAG: DEAD/DEAH box helicase family protein [Caldilinea sp.]|nr:DEAD/DEAH box helicase family protein [Caldilinea sp.]MCB0053289.1 DEAD/DEAH box helicase family protein [Caldilinea sp.]MCB0151646.1 DEAD/DEAH box helicase family protein [Caldilineaceae bacterium]MCO5214006.1 DEAD/DEAH box helicase family protein [Caldilinea sp.]MCW5845199.1 DEAD/DEAH box helicase family protein [Caldilinea sp.]
MKVTLFDFQEDALTDLHKKLGQARDYASSDNPQVISFSAPTGAGKTVVMTALFEDLLFGTAELAPQPDAVVLWLSDMPELNEQTRLKIEAQSDRIRVRQLVTVDAGFDAPRLPGGAIYFMNTQKLGADKLLTRKGDERHHTIWETLSATATAAPNRFYVIIDEAHRGARTGRAAATAQTIMQKFLLGSPEDGLVRMPIVVGISATPKRFEEMLAASSSHTLHKVHVSTEAVRASGLLKDRILLHYPDDGSQAEMSLLGVATTHWQAMRRQWQAYCTAEGEPVVRPLLVIQVEDGTDKLLTRSDLPAALAQVESILGRKLEAGEVAHTFHDTGDLDVGARTVRYIEASRIEAHPKVNIVLFKMSLSTGWDCPRAEVMMSFRRANDHTYIAQLLGRMVRSPLARRIEKDAALNDVHLFLPHYNQATVDAIIADLKNVEDVPPAITGVARELITLKRRAGTEAIFAATQKLVTYRVNKVRVQSALRRLMGLGRALTHDRIDEDAQQQVTAAIVAAMHAEIAALRTSGRYEQLAKIIVDVDIATKILQGTILLDEPQYYVVQAAAADIDRFFRRAGQRLGNGLEMAYWKAQGTRPAGEVQLEVAVLVDEVEAMARLEALAAAEFNARFEQHKFKIAALKEARRQHYEKLRLATAVPQPILWALPDSIDFHLSPSAPFFEKHLYVDDKGNFQVALGSWEEGVLREELADPAVVGWLRNLDRKPWSLEIPYTDHGVVTPMFPDLLIVRQVGDAYRFDILEPHDPSRDDNAVKAVGLARFAEQHWGLFDRIQLIRKRTGPDGNEHFYRLDMGKEALRKKVLAVETNAQLDALFVTDATPRQT